MCNGCLQPCGTPFLVSLPLFVRAFCRKRGGRKQDLSAMRKQRWLCRAPKNISGLGRKEGIFVLTAPKSDRILFFNQLISVDGDNKATSWEDKEHKPNIGDSTRASDVGNANTSVMRTRPYSKSSYLNRQAEPKKRHARARKDERGFVRNSQRAFSSKFEVFLTFNRRLNSVYRLRRSVTFHPSYRCVQPPPYSNVQKLVLCVPRKVRR